MKNKIKCGQLPKGSRLPSRADLCEEYHISNKTVRRAADMLAQEGLIETAQRKRPVVISGCSVIHKNALLTMQRADAAAVNDILKTAIPICYPLNASGMAKCRGDDWEIPEAILCRMNPDQPKEFWQLSNLFWRFFISRNENELMLRVVALVILCKRYVVYGFIYCFSNSSGRTGLEKKNPCMESA